MKNENPRSTNTTILTPDNAALRSAVNFLKSGYCVIPIRGDGTKAPAVSWHEFQTRRPSPGEVRGWWGDGSNYGLAVVGGTISGGLEIIDIDDASLIPEFMELVEEASPGLMAMLPRVKTPKGEHLYYRHSGEPQGNMKLAMSGERQTAIETRGEGGYVLTIGSPAACHPSGRTYEKVEGSASFKSIPTLTAEQRDLLLTCARSFNKYIQPQHHVTGPKHTSAEGTGLRSGDDFNQRGDVRALLEKHGWKYLRNGRLGELWQRPDGSHTSGTMFPDGSLYVFSSNAGPLEMGRAYSPFGLFAMLECGGDFEAAAKALAAQGYGEKRAVKTQGVAIEDESQLNEWSDPQPLPDGLKPVPSLSEMLLPDSLRPWLADVSERMQVPLDYPAAAAIVGIASVIGSQLRVRPKQFDDWSVTPNIWGAIIGPPGAMKSPAISEAHRPLHRLVRDAHADFQSRKLEWDLQKEKREATKLYNREKMKKTLRSGGDLGDFAVALSEIKEPTERRLVVNDTTIEALGEILNENPNGVLVFRDELTGWLRSLDDERRPADRAFFLEAWNGSGTFDYDRIGRGHLRIESATVSFFGGIQPGPLSAYLRQAASIGGDDGLMQRFQLTVYPDAPREWTNVDRWPEKESRNNAFETFRRLSDIAALGLACDTDDDGLRFLRFRPDAQEFFDAWHADLMQTVRSGELEHPIFESHLIKFRKLVPALSLIFHLCDVAEGKAKGGVSLLAVQQAAAWHTYLWEHAQRIYGLALGADLLGARSLAKHLLAGDLPDGFRARDVYQKGWAGLATSETVRGALDALSVYGWIQTAEIRSAAGGRPTAQFFVNPRIREGKL